MKKAKIRIVICWIILGIVLLGVGYTLRGENHYHRVFGTESLLMNFGPAISEGQGYAGMMLTSGPCVSLEEGKYRIRVNYSASNTGNYIMLLSQERDYGWSNISIEGNEDIPIVYLDQNLNCAEFNVSFASNVNSLEICSMYGGEGSFSINSIEIEVQSEYSNKDSLIIPMLIWIFIGILGGIYSKSSEEKRKHIIILSIVVIFSSVPCFMNYLVNGHDMPFEVGRIVGIADGMRSGQFPVRIHPTAFSEYGYDVSIFYPELFLYLPACLYLCGCSLVNSIHIFIFLLNVGSVVTMYYCAKNISKNENVGLLSSIIYGLASYRLVYEYLMNGFGSGAALVFIPIVILGLYEIFVGNNKKWWILVLGLSGVFQSHILSFVICCMFILGLIIFDLIFVRKYKKYIYLLFSAILFIGLNLWFIIPFVQFYFSDIQTASLAGEPAVRALSIVNLLGIWPEFGMGIQTVNKPVLGVPVIVDLVLIIGTIVFFVKRKSENIGKRYIVLAVVGFIALFMATKYFPWEMICNIPGIGLIAQMVQHPQRVLHVAIPCLSIVAATGFDIIEKENKEKPIWILVITVSVLTSSFFLHGYMRQDIRIAKGEIDSSFIGTNEYLYSNTNTDELIPNSISGIEGIRIENYKKNGTNLSFYYETQAGGQLNLPLLFFPGYYATCNEESIPVNKGENNIMTVPLQDESEGQINIAYKEPTLWRIADIISIFLFLSFGCIVIKDKYSQKRKNGVINNELI